MSGEPNYLSISNAASISASRTASNDVIGGGLAARGWRRRRLRSVRSPLRIRTVALAIMKHDRGAVFAGGQHNVSAAQGRTRTKRGGKKSSKLAANCQAAVLAEKLARCDTRV
jgi:hypothetical protein